MTPVNAERAREFWADTSRLVSLAMAKRDDEAVVVALEIVKGYPELPAESSYLLACAYNGAGRYVEALHTLETALDRGACWHESLLLSSPGLKPLRDQQQFHRIVARSKIMLDALPASSPAGAVFSPERIETAGAPLFLPLHGGGDIPGGHDEHWAAAVGIGVLVAIPRSSQRRSSDMFWWGNPLQPFDIERCGRDIQAAYDQVGTRHGFDRTRVVLGGFSQGASLAVTLALHNRPFPIRGFTCVGPGMESIEALIPLMEPAAARGLRGWILAGERERGLELITRLSDALTFHGIACQLEVVPGLGHEFPHDFGSRLQSGLGSVLAAGSA